MCSNSHSFKGGVRLSLNFVSICRLNIGKLHLYDCIVEEHKTGVQGWMRLSSVRMSVSCVGPGSPLMEPLHDEVSLAPQCLSMRSRIIYNV